MQEASLMTKTNWWGAALLCGTFAGATAGAESTADWESVLGPTLAEEELAAQRGREGTLLQLSELSQGATLTDNVVHASVNGDNIVTQGAFQGASGIVTLIQNTGNHVIIQDATILNITVRP
jgi:hypothetical protein